MDRGARPLATRPALTQPGLQLAFDIAYDTMLATVAGRDRLDAAITVMAADSEFTPVVTRLGCLRGVSTLTAFWLAVEIGDWHRVNGRSIGAYLGLVPTESSSGGTRSQGSPARRGTCTWATACSTSGPAPSICRSGLPCPPRTGNTSRWWPTGRRSAPTSTACSAAPPRTSSSPRAPARCSSGRWGFGGTDVDLLSGTLDEICIYNRALSAAEIQGDMAAAVGPPTP